jgi:hypothetical protein
MIDTGMQDFKTSLLVEVKYLRYRGPLVTAQNSGYDWFLVAANGWGIIHPIPDKAHHSRLKRGAPT